MFSGYKQSRAFVHEVLLEVEQRMRDGDSGEVQEEGDRHLHHRRQTPDDELGSWDEGDLRRLIGAFLGARFPMALALNKSDLPSAAKLAADVIDALPLHGAHVGVPVSAREEMGFVRCHVVSGGGEKDAPEPGGGSKYGGGPHGVWECLSSAMELREPVLVFPVNDMRSYEPLPGMTKYAAGVTRPFPPPAWALAWCRPAAPLRPCGTGDGPSMTPPPSILLP